MNPVAWVLLGAAGGAGLAFVIFLGVVHHWIANAEVGVDPFDGLPTFDDDEAAALLEAGA